MDGQSVSIDIALALIVKAVDMPAKGKFIRWKLGVEKPVDMDLFSVDAGKIVQRSAVVKWLSIMRENVRVGKMYRRRAAGAADVLKTRLSCSLGY